jgi:hypothetical protein
MYLGCANETWPRGDRALNQASYSHRNSMTIKFCQAFCSANYDLAGVEYGSECYCANDLQPGSTVGAAGCNMPCSGNKKEICGGPYRVNVYQLTTFTPPITPPVVGDYVSQGCYYDTVGILATQTIDPTDPADPVDPTDPLDFSC